MISIRPRFHPARIATIVGLLAGGALPTACLFGGEEKGFEVTSETQVLEIDRDAQTITTMSRGWNCGGNVAVPESATYQERYLVAGGHLYRWFPGTGCRASVFKGSSSDIVGTWTTSSGIMGSVPVDDSSFCRESDYREVAAENEFFRKTKITLKITDSKISQTVAGEFCSGEWEGHNLISDNGWVQDSFVVSEKNCASVKITRASGGASARVVGEETRAGTKLRFITADTTCTTVMPYYSAEKPDCSDGGAEARFQECIAATGFFGESAVLKPAAATALRRHPSSGALNLLR